MAKSRCFLEHATPDCPGKWKLMKDKDKDPWCWIECARCGKVHEQTERNVYGVIQDDARRTALQALAREGRVILEDDDDLPNRIKGLV